MFIFNIFPDKHICKKRYEYAYACFDNTHVRIKIYRDLYQGIIHITNYVMLELSGSEYGQLFFVLLYMNFRWKSNNQKAKE